MDVDECFRERLLRKISVDKDKINNSLKISENKLNRARKLFDNDFFDEAFLSAYTCIFHAARALLYKDGIQEKSHFATHLYIKERYCNIIPDYLIEGFLNYQLERHQILYGFETEISQEKSENIILDAEDFLEEVKKILNIKNEK
jgi:uncharacterized protein (UPF0332 family)